ncbi:MAG: hypothetical protein ACXABY_03645 [Candidatus Thorarchaeota archaeon]
MESRRTFIFAIFASLLFLIPNHSAHTFSEESPVYFNAASQNIKTKLAITDHAGGVPPDAHPFRQWMVTARIDELEVWTSAFELVSNITLPLPIREIDVSDEGAIIASLVPQGLAYLEIDDNGFILLFDVLSDGVWERLELGNGFLCAWNVLEKQIHVIDIIESDLTSMNLVPRAVMQGNMFAVDSDSMIVFNESKVIFWNRSVHQAPVRLASGWMPRWIDLRGSLLVWGEMSDFLDPVIVIGHISSLETQAKLETLAWFGGLGFPVAWNSEYLYLNTRDWYNDYSLVAIRTSNRSNISAVQVFDGSEYSHFRIRRIISAGESGFLALGMNFIEWWNITQLQPTRVQMIEYPGHITDIAVARNVYEPIVWGARGQMEVPEQRTWGYPVVRAGEPPIVGDIADLVVLTGRVTYEDGGGVRKFLSMPRMEMHPLPISSSSHPTAEPELYNGSLYRTNDDVLNRWSVDQDLAFEKETIFQFDSDGPRRHLRCLIDNYYLAADPNSIVVMDLNTLVYLESEIEFPDEPFMMESLDDKILVLAKEGLSSYQVQMDWPSSVELEFLGSIPLSADVFTVLGQTIYAANSTHVIKILVEGQGSFMMVESIYAPTSLRTNQGGDIEQTEPGDIVADEETGWIIRAAGAYGMWIIENLPSEHGTLNESSYSAQADYLTPLTIGFVGGAAPTLLVLAIIMNIRKHRLEFETAKAREKRLLEELGD